jgi:hypothetical protein
MNWLANLILKKSLDDCSIQELQQLINKYPYFNAGHLLLAKKLQSEAPGQLTDSFKKATLYFHPLQLIQTISGTGSGELIISKEPEIIPAKTEEPSTEPVIAEAIFSNNEQRSNAIEQLNTGNEQETPVTRDMSSATEQPAYANLFARVLMSEDLSSEAPTKDEAPADKPESSISQGPEGLPGIVLADENQVSPKESLQAGSQESITFEPYHLVDYFASQGIKIVIEEKPTDRFTRQLKSFTEWLKAMKKLPASENIPASNTAVEQKVEQLAETSLTNTEVVTEAMAEVWEKQGNHEKAIEIYHKLSLLEPSKSLYFASRISDLKKIN